MVPLVFAAEAGTLELSDRTGADVRAGSSAAATIFDAVTAATARATLRDRRWSVTVGYSPTLTGMAAADAPPTAYVLQAENVGAIWHDRHLTLSLLETGSYGWETTASLVPPPGTLTAPSTIPSLPSNLTTLQMVGFQSTLGGLYRPSRRWEFELVFGWMTYGGARDVDRAVIPLMYDLTTMARAGYAMTRLDRATLRVTGSRPWTHAGPCVVEGLATSTATGSATTCAPDSYVGAAYVGDRHRFSRSSEGMAEVGYAVAQSRLDSGQPYSTSTFPVADVTYVVDFGPRAARRTSLRFDGQLGPIVNLRSGVPDYSARATGTFLVALPSRKAVSLGFGALQTIYSPEERPFTIFYTSAIAEVPVGKFVGLSATAAYYLENQAGAPTTTSVALFLGATFHTLPLRFQL
jgi:hypothetical protein